MSIYLKESKKFLVMLSLVLAFFMTTQAPGTASANVNNVTSSDEFTEKQEVVQNALVFKDGVYQIDESLTDGKLTDSEIKEVNLYYKNLDPELLEAIENGMNPADGQVAPTVAPLLPAAVIAFLGTLAVFVGWELASSITADFYKWGVTSGCKKWKDVDVVKSFCTANDYL